MMQFSNPIALWLMVLLPIFMRRQIITAWFKAADPKLIKPNLVAGRTQSLWPFTLFYILAVLALANPVIRTSIPLPYEGQDNVVIAMQLGDCLLANKAAAYEASGMYENSALVVFDDKAYLISPLSPDKNILRHFLKDLTPDMRVGDGDISARALKKFVARQVAVGGGDLIVFDCGTPAVHKIAAVADAKNLGPYIAVFLALFFLARMPMGGLVSVALLVVCLSSQGHARWWHNEKQALNQIIADGAAYYAAGDYAAAAQIWERGGDRCAHCMHNLGNALAFMGDIDGAIQSYRRALKTDPGHEDARFNLEYLLRAMPGEAGASSASPKKQFSFGDDKTDGGDSVARIPSADSDEIWLERIETDHGALLRGRIMRQRGLQ